MRLLPGDVAQRDTYYEPAKAPCLAASWHALKRHVKRHASVLRLLGLLSLSGLTLHVLLSSGSERQLDRPSRETVTLAGKAKSPQVKAYSSCSDDMPLLEEDAQVLTRSTLSDLQSALKNSSWIAPLGRRTGRLGTKGVKLSFNTAGIDQLYRTANMSHMAAFFDAERLPSANAWVVTFVAVEGCPGFHADQGIWAIHRDELRTHSGGMFERGEEAVRILPHIVTVFDVYTPKEIVGGATWIWHPNSTRHPAESPPAAIVPPKANSKFVFRGDVFHGVSGQNSSRSEATISLVLEQYKVPTALYAQTTEFRWQRFRTEYRAKRPDLRVYHLVTEEQRTAAARLLRQTPSSG